jgi:gamma-glutamylcyclotransferase (GGCT)/AIG2-like uncharacterized protein YtfP
MKEQSTEQLAKKFKQFRELPIFVYGSLRKGYWNYSHLDGSTKYEIEGSTKGKLYMVGGAGFPALVRGDEDVFGELMFIKPEKFKEVLARLDRLEGYYPLRESQSMYLRRKIMVYADGREYEAWGYIWNRGERSLGEHIINGDYTEYKSKEDAIWE